MRLPRSTHRPTEDGFSTAGSGSAGTGDVVRFGALIEPAIGTSCVGLQRACPVFVGGPAFACPPARNRAPARSLTLWRSAAEQADPVVDRGDRLVGDLPGPDGSECQHLVQ